MDWRLPAALASPYPLLFVASGVLGSVACQCRRTYIDDCIDDYLTATFWEHTVCTYVHGRGHLRNDRTDLRRPFSDHRRRRQQQNNNNKTNIKQTRLHIFLSASPSHYWIACSFYASSPRPFRVLSGSLAPLQCLTSTSFARRPFPSHTVHSLPYTYTQH